jgi:hypothetical protein
MRPEVISVAAVVKQRGLPTASFSNSNAQVDYAGIGQWVHSFKPGGGLQQMSGEFSCINSFEIVEVAGYTDDFIYIKTTTGQFLLQYEPSLSHKCYR